MSNIWGILAKKLTSGNDAVSFSSGYLNMEFDVITSENHSWSSTVTSNPVENGQPVCDHIQRNPDKLDIKGIISNASMKRWRGSFIEKVAGMLAPESEVQQAFDKLRKLMDERLPVTVYTRYRTYPNMVLTELSIPRQTSDGDSIEFDAKFTHIRRVSTLLIDAADAGINPKQASTPSKGRQAGPIVTKGEEIGTKVGSDIAENVAAVVAKGQEVSAENQRIMDEYLNNIPDDK